MGVEVSQFALPHAFPAMEAILRGGLNGQVVQTIGHLIEGLKDGESGEEFIEDLGPPYGDEELAAVRMAFESIQHQPHILAACFGNGSRGHDHWAYLLELAAGPEEKQHARAAVFGSTPVSETATASQGAPIRWSSLEQVKQIDGFLSELHFDRIRERFTGFPEDRTFYKRRKNDSLEFCLQEIGGICQLFSIAAENELIVFSILD